MKHSHRFWKEQCAAANRLRAKFGAECALDYLIAEKLLNFVRVTRHDAVAAAELPTFAAEVRRLFTHAEIRDFLYELQRQRKIARQESVEPGSLFGLRVSRPGLERLLLLT